MSSTETASRGSVGFLPENPYFYKYLTGAETIAFYGKLCGIGRREIKERTAELLKLVELEELEIDVLLATQRVCCKGLAWLRPWLEDRSWLF